MGHYEDKWHRNTIAAERAWIDELKKAESYDHFCEKLAEFLTRETGTTVTKSDVMASIPAANWKEFQRNVEAFVDSWKGGIETAYREHKWSNGLLKAFTKRKA